MPPLRWQVRDEYLTVQHLPPQIAQSAAPRAAQGGGNAGGAQGESPAQSLASLVEDAANNPEAAAAAAAAALQASAPGTCVAYHGVSGLTMRTTGEVSGRGPLLAVRIGFRVQILNPNPNTQAQYLFKFTTGAYLVVPPSFLRTLALISFPSPALAGSRAPKAKEGGKGKTSTDLALVGPQGPNGPSNSLVPAGAAAPSLTPAK